jgi:hypothetical protein
METLHTVHWITECHLRGHTSRQDWWLRVDPPAVAFLSGLGDHDLQDARGDFHTNSEWDCCTLYPREGAWSVLDVIYHVLPFGLFESPSDAAPGGPMGPEWEREWVELDGRKRVRCRLTYPEGAYQVEHTFWIDPPTGYVFREEHIETDPATGELAERRIHHSFDYDPTVPDGIFDLPPPSKPLRVKRLEDSFPELIGTLKPGDREAINQAIALSDAGWVAGDFRAFSNAWLFRSWAAVFPLPSRKEWSKLVRGSRGRWSRWESTPMSITASDCVHAATASMSCIMVPARNTFWVKSELRVEWDGGSWEGEADYYVRKWGSGYRVIHWRYPSAEIEEAVAGQADGLG